MTNVFTPERADAFHDESEKLRLELQALTDARSVPLAFVGLGSLFTLHLGGTPLRQAADVTPLSRQVGLLFHMHGLLNGVAIAGRGDFYQSLPMTQAHRDKAKAVLASFVSEYGDLISRLAKENSTNRRTTAM